MFKKPFLYFIRLYQKTLSLDHGPLKKFFPFGRCRFHPTCSEYSYQAIEKFGVIKGLFLASKRMIHCHPFSPGGDDPVPGKFTLKRPRPN
ncbi:MAG: membrane protein insertion efficiency factor YidD [Patescibacteria group bacterium]|nr:membrane protein insertion efficiency factor YidD [Patescibacteria group bacterium]